MNDLPKKVFRVSRVSGRTLWLGSPFLAITDSQAVPWQHAARLGKALSGSASLHVHIAHAPTTLRSDYFP